MLFESPHFRLHADDQIATLWMDFRTNVAHRWTRNLLAELARVIRCVAQRPSLDVLVVRSQQPGVFATEYDASELLDISVRSAAGVLAQRGQEVLQQLQQLPLTSVALLEGTCTDAGLELALACTMRVAVATPRWQLGFPNTQRGLLPFWGGTHRLATLVGRTTAKALLQSGRLCDPTEALRWGLVDRVFRPESAGTELQTLVDRLQDQGEPKRPRRWWHILTTPTVAVDETTPTTPELDTLAHAMTCPEGECAAIERQLFAQMLFSDRTRRRLELDLAARREARFYPTPINPVPPRPQRIGIVGGGQLGTILATRLANQGCEVVVQEQNATMAEQVRVKLNRAGVAAQVTAEWVGFENAEFVIEAADEDVGLKRNVLSAIEQRVRPRVPVATASTTINIDALQAEAHRPMRLLGWHLPNVLPGNPVVEVVGGAKTSNDTLAAVLRWSQQWNFAPVLTADRAARLVRFVWLNYLNEGVALVAEGLEPAPLDAACRQRGLVRGPLQWCDELGFDRLAEQTAHMQFARGDRFARHLLFERLQPYGWIGRENGEGFYRYGRRVRANELVRMVLWRDLDADATAHYIFDPAEALATSVERLALMIINTAATCLPDEPDADPATVDWALAMGMGCFADEGGPLRYADRLGLAHVVDRLALFAERFGPRFQPCDELQRRAEAGEAFYGLAQPTTKALPNLRAA